VLHVQHAVVEETRVEMSCGLLFFVLEYFVFFFDNFFPPNEQDTTNHGSDQNRWVPGLFPSSGIRKSRK
jgi:hypothetical protein